MEKGKIIRLKKVMGGYVLHHKQEDRNGVPVGLVEGYLATFDIDRGKWQFLPGAFLEAIDDLQKRNRQLRFKDHHARTVGGFPPESLREDKIGLLAIAEINLEMEQGRDLFSLVRQGVITDFSVGWSLSDEDLIIENGIRKISKSGLWEASLVSEPMNINAVVTSIKGAVDIRDIPNKLATRAHKWDVVAANGRLRTHTGSSDEPSESYRNAFLWFDDAEADEFGSYKLQVVDIVDGEPAVVPRAVFAVRAVLEGARGGVNLPDEDREKVEATVNALYERMDLEPPFDGGSKTVSIVEIQGLPDSLLHDMIKMGRLSGTAVDYLVRLRQSGSDAGAQKRVESGDTVAALDALLDRLT